MKKIKKNNIFIVLIILIFIIIACFVFLNKEEEKEKAPNEGDQYFEVLDQEDINDLTEEEKQQALEGVVQTFKVSSAKGVYPKFISGQIKPGQPVKGMDQEILIKIEDPTGLKEVKLEIRSESGEELIEELDLELVEGDSFRGDWRGVWQPHDFERVIRWVFKVENNEGKTDDLTYFTTQ
jgi:Na+-transporting methylmalonyl-CoA/oxaloacetate decarboxylase gamma subunit